MDNMFKSSSLHIGKSLMPLHRNTLLSLSSFSFPRRRASSWICIYSLELLTKKNNLTAPFFHYERCKIEYGKETPVRIPCSQGFRIQYALKKTVQEYHFHSSPLINQRHTVPEVDLCKRNDIQWKCRTCYAHHFLTPFFSLLSPIYFFFCRWANVLVLWKPFILKRVHQMKRGYLILMNRLATSRFVV